MYGPALFFEQHWNSVLMYNCRVRYRYLFYVWPYDEYIHTKTLTSVYITARQFELQRFNEIAIWLCWLTWLIKWKYFPRNWLFVRGIHRSPVDSPHKGQWRGALMFSLICAWMNVWASNRDAGDLRRHRANYDVTIMGVYCFVNWWCQWQFWRSKSDTDARIVI